MGVTTTRSTRQVPFFDYRKVFAARQEAILAVVRDVIDRGAFILQEDVSRFEASLAAYLGAQHAVGVGNCTDALTVALRVVGVGPGDEVIVPTHTMVATPAAAVAVGATPVPVDIGADGLIDPAAVEAAITPRTRALMPVHLNGRTCDMAALIALADRRDLHVVEDAAQALGARFRGQCAGTFGRAGCFSFYPAKALGCLGDGGALVTDDEAVAGAAMLLRDHGRDADGDVPTWGWNSRLDNLHAAVLELLMEDYPRQVERRRSIAAMYQACLGGEAHIRLPAAPDADVDRFDVYQNYEVLAERRDDLKRFLADRDVGTLVQWGGKALHQWPGLGMRAVLPVADRYFERCLMLPMNTSLADEDVVYVCETVRAFYAS